MPSCERRDAGWAVHRSPSVTVLSDHEPARWRTSREQVTRRSSFASAEGLSGLTTPTTEPETA